MPFQAGASGNPKGRPKQTTEQQEQSRKFKELLRLATVPALNGIIEIANDKRSKDRLNACRYIIDKFYGANTDFYSEDDMNPITIRLVTCSPNNPKLTKDADTDDDWID